MLCCIILDHTIIYMSKPIATVIGIDIGASTTKIAAVERGAIDIVTNEANFRETPTIVGYGEGERKIGEIGGVKLKSNFKNTVVAPHRFLGLARHANLVKEQSKFNPCPTSSEGQTITFKVEHNGRPTHLSPDQVLASFMTHLRSILQHNNLDDKMIMFSVPPFFSQVEKRALLNAAEISGLKNVRLVSSAVAMGLDYGSFKKSEMGEGKHVLFLDFGHSKLSASLIKFTDSILEVVMEKSARNLGCRDIDRMIFEYMAKKFQEKKGLDVKQSKRACLKLVEAIEKQRKILTGITETDVSIESLFEDEDLSQPFTRQIMFKSAESIFSQIHQFLTSVKESVTQSGIKFDSIELVGGGSRIPKFIEMVQEVFSMAPSRTINSSETIARGATIAAVQESGLFKFFSFNILNRLGHELACISKDEGKQTEVLIIDDSSYVPNEKVIKIPSNQVSQLTVVSKQQGQISNSIVSYKLTDSASSENQLACTFKIDANGFIKLTSVLDNSNRQITFTEQYHDQIKQEVMKQYKQTQRQMYINDLNIVKAYEKKNQLEAYVYKQKELLSKDEIKKYVTQEQIQRVQRLLQQVSSKLQNQEDSLNAKHFDQKKKQIEQNMRVLQQSVNKKKAEMLMHLRDLQELKNSASETINQIQQRFRNSKPVAEVCEQLRQIEYWADQAIKISKTKQPYQLPVVPPKDIETQHQNIKILVNRLLNPPRTQPQQPRHQRYEQQYEPESYYERPRFASTTYGPQTARNSNSYYQQPRRRPQQQYYDPFGMSRSGYYGPGYPFGGFF